MKRTKLSRYSRRNYVEFNKEDISDLKQDAKEVQHEVLELKKQILYMETYSRRENAKFFGLPEGPPGEKPHRIFKDL